MFSEEFPQGARPRFEPDTFPDRRARQPLSYATPRPLTYAKPQYIPKNQKGCVDLQKVLIFNALA
jgi:hypothetical protein